MCAANMKMLVFMDFSRQGRQKSNVHPTNYISVWYLQWAVLTGIIIDKKQVPEDMAMRNNAAVVTGWTLQGNE